MVTLRVDDKETETVGLEDGTAKFEVGGLSRGPHAITAEYGGDGRFAGSTANQNHVVGPAKTETIVSSPESSERGASVPFSVWVRIKGTETGVPSGSVRLFEGDLELANSPLIGAGRATVPITFNARGRHVIRAVYVPDPDSPTNFTGSESVCDHEVD